MNLGFSIQAWGWQAKMTAGLMAAYSFSRRFETLSELSPSKYIGTI